MNREKWLLLLTLALWMPAGLSVAEITSQIERFGRLQGVCWGDGYHACKSSGCRPLADLPPVTRRAVSVSHHNPAPTHRRRATFYDRFDAINRAKIGSGNCDSPGCDRTQCDGIGCDSVNVYDASMNAPDLSDAAPHVLAPTVDPTAKVELPAFHGPPTPEFVPAIIEPEAEIVPIAPEPTPAPAIVKPAVEKPDAVKPATVKPSIIEPAKPIRPAPPAKPTKLAPPQKISVPLDPADEATFDLQPPLTAPLASGIAPSESGVQYNQLACRKRPKTVAHKREVPTPRTISVKTTPVPETPDPVTPVTATPVRTIGTSPTPRAIVPIYPGERSANSVSVAPISRANSPDKPMRLAQQPPGSTFPSSRPAVQFAERGSESDSGVIHQPSYLR